ncbi:MAG: DMT family transporter [Candidatus Competibacteraceae bacterium]|nr:DMT family transporter [Candidatus Competibacteraceae bacterium]
MKWAADYITPMQIVFIRVLLGFCPVFLFALSKNLLRREHLTNFVHFLVMAVLATALYYFGFAKGTQLLLSGIAGAVSGAIPIFAVITAIIFLPGERISRNKLLGIVIGFIGVLMIAKPFGEAITESTIYGVLYMVMGSLSLGVSFVYAKKFISPLKIPAPALVTYQLGAALVLLALVTDFDGISRITENVQVLLGLIIGLGLLGTGLAYIIYYYIVEKLGAVRASSVTYIPPIVALLIGALLVGEEIQVIDYVATLFIFFGVIMLNRQSKPRRPAR